MREGENVQASISNKAGVGRDRMQLGNARGQSICILQPALLANVGINEFCPKRACKTLDSNLQHTVHHILQSLECLRATMSSNRLRMRHY